MVLRHNASKQLILSIVGMAALAGCEMFTTESEHPIDNPIPALKPGVHTIKTVDIPPAPTSEMEPDFPLELSYVVSGMAFVAFTVRSDGSVADASIVRTDDTLFGKSAVAAILKWRFRPAQVKGVPVDCRMTMPFYFSNAYSSGADEPEPASLPRSPPTSQTTTIQPR